VLAGATLVLLLRERGGFARRIWPGLLLVAAVAALTLVPLGRYAVDINRDRCDAEGLDEVTTLRT